MGLCTGICALVTFFIEPQQNGRGACALVPTIQTIDRLPRASSAGRWTSVCLVWSELACLHNYDWICASVDGGVHEPAIIHGPAVPLQNKLGDMEAFTLTLSAGCKISFRVPLGSTPSLIT